MPPSQILHRGQNFFDQIYGKVSKRVMGQMDRSGTEDLGLTARLMYGYILSNTGVLTAAETSFVLLAGLIPQDVRAAKSPGCSDGDNELTVSPGQPTTERPFEGGAEQWRHPRGSEGSERGCHQDMRSVRDEETGGECTGRVGLEVRRSQDLARYNRTSYLLPFHRLTNPRQASATKLRSAGTLAAT